ncbi:MAG: RidA family protein [Ferruginibacter sp.]
MIKRVSSGSPWEESIGYSRAVRIGNIVEVAGTTAMDGVQLIGKGDLYAQTVFVFKKIEKALIELGVTMKDVVRTRIYVTDISQWEIVGRAHGEFFQNTKPVSTMVEVRRLIDDNLLIEIEATAIATE